MPKETKEEKLKKFKEDFVKALEDFALSKYKKALSDTLIERNILDKKGNVIETEQMLIGNKVRISDEKFKASGEFIAIINKQPKSFKFDQEKKQIIEIDLEKTKEKEKKKNADNMQDRNRLKWYKILVAIFYAIFKFLKMLFTAIPNKIASTIKTKNIETSHVNAMRTYNSTPLAQRSISRASEIDFEMINVNNLDNTQNKMDKTVVLNEEEEFTNEVISNRIDNIRLSNISDDDLNTNLNINEERNKLENPNAGMSERDDNEIEIEINGVKLEENNIKKSDDNNIINENNNDDNINNENNNEEDFKIESNEINDNKISTDVIEIKNKEEDLVDIKNVDLKLSKEDEKVVNKDNIQENILKEKENVKNN